MLNPLSWLAGADWGRTLRRPGAAYRPLATRASPFVAQRTYLAGQRARGVAHRDEALDARDRQDRVVAVRPARRRVDEDVDVLVDRPHWAGLVDHDLKKLGLKDLLQRVKGEPRELALNKVRPVLHDDLELHVAVRALPPRHQVEHVDALGGPPLGLARGARQLDAQDGEDGLVGDGVAHLDEPGVEVDLAGEGADGEERGVAHAQQRGDRLLRGAGGFVHVSEPDDYEIVERA
jgi:hypothetical protein